MMYLRLNIRGPSCHQKTVASLCPFRPENSYLDEGCSLSVPLRDCSLNSCLSMTMNIFSLSWFECRVRLALYTLSLSRFAYLVVFCYILLTDVRVDCCRACENRICLVQYPQPCHAMPLQEHLYFPNPSTFTQFNRLEPRNFCKVDDLVAS